MEEATGWFQDPFGRHEGRWFSAGRPTELVRDADNETSDLPPSAEYDGPLEELPEHLPADGADLKRADAATRVDQSVRPGDGPQAVLDSDGLPTPVPPR